MRRSIIMSLLLSLVTLGSAMLAQPDPGWAQATPEAESLPDGVTIDVIGATEDQEGETLALIEITMAPGAELPITPDEPREAVFEIIEGTMTIFVNEGEVLLVRDGERMHLGPDDDEFELVKGDVLSSIGADFLIENPGEGAAIARDAESAFAQGSGTAKMRAAVKGCRSFCPGA